MQTLGVRSRIAQRTIQIRQRFTYARDGIGSLVHAAANADSLGAEVKSYLERRANEEIVRAQNAVHPRAVKAHYHLASGYLNLLFPDGEVAASPAPSAPADTERLHGGWHHILDTAFGPAPAER